MPDMDGIETLEKLKEDNPDSNAVYIALTANAISGAREMYLNAGFADYISKPVEGPKLEKLIMSYLPPEKLLDTPISV
jgi:CheY-like chemotaxis protein